jgi:hypothetical protein
VYGRVVVVDALRHFLIASEGPAVFTSLGFIIGLIVIPIMGQKIREGTNQQTVAFGEEYYAQRWVQRFEYFVNCTNMYVNGMPCKPLSEIKQDALMEVWREIQVAARGVAHKPKNVEGVEDTWEVWPNYDQAGSTGAGADNSERRGDEQALSGSGGDTGTAGCASVVREPDVDGTLSPPPPDANESGRLAGVPAATSVAYDEWQAAQLRKLREQTQGVTIDVWRKAHVTP